MTVQEKELRPAPEANEDINSTEVEELPHYIHQYYHEFFLRQPGKLVTPEEISRFHQGLSGARKTSTMAIRSALFRLRRELKEQRLISVGSKPGGAYGFYLLPLGAKITRLSQIGVSPFKDEDRLSLKVIPGLSILSRKNLERNPLLKEQVEEVSSLFDELEEPNVETYFQSPRLTFTQRSIIASLINRSFGVSVEEILRDLQANSLAKGIKIEHDVQISRKLVLSHMTECRAKIGDQFQIYFLLTGDKLTGTGFVLMKKQPVGSQIRLETVNTENFAEPIREAVDYYCNILEVVKSGKGETGLMAQFSTAQRRLFITLARKYQFPFSIDSLLPVVYPDYKFSSSEDWKELRKRLHLIRNRLQEKIQKSGFKIFTVYEALKGRAYILLPEDLIKNGEKGEIALIGKKDLIGINSVIHRPVLAMCNRARRTESVFHPILGSQEREVLLEIAKNYPYGCRGSEAGKKFFLGSKNLRRYTSGIVGRIRRKLTKNFKREDVAGLTIFGIHRVFENREVLYMFLPESLSKMTKGEVPIVYPGELINVDKEIKESIRKMLNLVKVRDFKLYPVFGRKERGMLVALAGSFPEGLSYQFLINLFFSDCQLPLDALQNQIRVMRRKMSEEFGEKISIRLIEKGYMLELKKGE